MIPKLEIYPSYKSIIEEVANLMNSAGLGAHTQRRQKSSLGEEEEEEKRRRRRRRRKEKKKKKKKKRSPFICAQ